MGGSSCSGIISFIVTLILQIRFVRLQLGKHGCEQVPWWNLYLGKTCTDNETVLRKWSPFSLGFPRRPEKTPTFKNRHNNGEEDSSVTESTNPGSHSLV